VMTDISGELIRFEEILSPLWWPNRLNICAHIRTIAKDGLWAEVPDAWQLGPVGRAGPCEWEQSQLVCTAAAERYAA
jgi:hypothetical protein